MEEYPLDWSPLSNVSLNMGEVLLVDLDSLNTLIKMVESYGS
jgi:hypothetical protein